MTNSHLVFYDPEGTRWRRFTHLLALSLGSLSFIIGSFIASLLLPLDLKPLSLPNPTAGEVMLYDPQSSSNLRRWGSSSKKNSSLFR